MAAVLIQDDSCLLQPESQVHVDYFSHNWKEADLVASWRTLTSSKASPAQPENVQRLENASWRTWMKSKFHLGTIPPEAVNWSKDADITWLYGPLYSCDALLEDSLNDNKLLKNSKNSSSNSHSNELRRCVSNTPAESSTASFKRKPILKRRSLSQIMADKSNLNLENLHSQTSNITNSYSSSSYTWSNSFNSVSSSIGSTSTSSTWSKKASRRIHFNETVEQCIVVDHDDESLTSSSMSNDIDHLDFTSDSDSEDDAGFFFIAPTTSKPSSNKEVKLIERLPSGILKYKDSDSEEESEEQEQEQEQGNENDNDSLEIVDCDYSYYAAQSHNTSTNRSYDYNSYDYSSVYPNEINYTTDNSYYSVSTPIPQQEKIQQEQVQHDDKKKHHKRHHHKHGHKHSHKHSNNSNSNSNDNVSSRLYEDEVDNFQIVPDLSSSSSTISSNSYSPSNVSGRITDNQCDFLWSPVLSPSFSPPTAATTNTTVVGVFEQ